MNLIDWINGVTKLNKTTMDEFQDNINDAIDEVQDNLDSEVETLNTTIGNIISVTTNTNGTAIKFSNGIMVCTKKVSLSNITINTSTGSLYVSSEINLGNFAESFSANPIVNVTLATDDYNGFVGELKRASNTTTSIGSILIYRPTTTTTGKYTAEVIAIGTYTTT